MSFVATVLAACGGPAGASMSGSHEGLVREFWQRVEKINRQTGARQLSVNELKQRLESGQDMLILDVREKNEFEEGAIPSAVHLDPSRIHDFGEQVGDQRLLVAYCTSGYRSGLAAVELERMVGRPVFNLNGGIIDWFNQGGDVVDSKGKPSERIHPYNRDWGRFIRAD